MNYRTLLAVIAISASLPALAQEQEAPRSQQPYLPRLADVMGSMQLRHFKLWYAGEVDNWELAKYELAQIKASIQDTTRLFPNLPAADMTIMNEPLEELRDAIEGKNRTKFAKDFEKVTAACNSCHKSAGVGFIIIRVPRTSPMMTSPFSDQSFSPK